MGLKNEELRNNTKPKPNDVFIKESTPKNEGVVSFSDFISENVLSGQPMGTAWNIFEFQYDFLAKRVDTISS